MQILYILFMLFTLLLHLLFGSHFGDHVEGTTMQDTGADCFGEGVTLFGSDVVDKTYEGLVLAGTYHPALLIL